MPSRDISNAQTATSLPSSYPAKPVSPLNSITSALALRRAAARRKPASRRITAPAPCTARLTAGALPPPSP
jgi:hypothetical protein